MLSLHPLRQAEVEDKRDLVPINIGSKLRKVVLTFQHVRADLLDRNSLGISWVSRISKIIGAMPKIQTLFILFRLSILALSLNIILLSPRWPPSEHTTRTTPTADLHHLPNNNRTADRRVEEQVMGSNGLMGMMKRAGLFE
jgi:hypothetical protein